MAASSTHDGSYFSPPIDAPQCGQVGFGLSVVLPQFEHSNSSAENRRVRRIQCALFFDILKHLSLLRFNDPPFNIHLQVSPFPMAGTIKGGCGTINRARIDMEAPPSIHFSKLRSSSRKGMIPIYMIPFSSIRAFWLPPTTTIFLKKSPLLRSGLISCARFCSSAMLNAD